MVNINEPATKFFGPNYPFVKNIPPTKVHVRLHNLKPGQHWKPLLQPLIESEQVLLPHPNPFTWFKVIFPFAWIWIHGPTLTRLEVVSFVEPAPVFVFSVTYIQTRWMLNDVLTAPGNYSYGGTATLAWKDVPRQ